MRCISCDQEFKSYTAVSLHYRNKHGSSAQLEEMMRQKYVNEKCGGVIPTCKCGCGVVPKYYDFARGYAKFIHGHASCVNNNWGHNKNALSKSQDVRREQIADGDWTPWNKGETKETDKRLAISGSKGSQTILSQPDELERRSENMSKQWKSGVLVPLIGPASSQWKGGTSALQGLSRSKVFKVWSVPKLAAAKYECQNCHADDGRGVIVHHDGERFAAILHKAVALFGEVGDDFEKKSTIADWVAAYHTENNVSGIVLCEHCHIQVHADLGETCNMSHIYLHENHARQSSQDHQRGDHCLGPSREL